MGVEENFNKVLERTKLEEAKKDNNIGGDVIYHIIRSGAVAALTMGAILVIGYVIERQAPLKVYGDGFRFWLYAVGLIIWVFGALMGIILREVLILRLMIWSFRIGRAQGGSNRKIKDAADNKSGIKKKGWLSFGRGKNAFDVSEIEDNHAQPSRGRDLVDDSLSILEIYYSHGKPISRDGAMQTLAARKNSKKSAEEALVFLLNAGILKKGPERNDKIKVVPTTFLKAKKAILEYIQQ